MRLHLEFKSGKKVIYTIENYSIKEEEGFLEMYSSKFPSYVKRFELSKLDLISHEEIVFKS